jgi:uncharacterized membrane protein
MGNWRFIHGLNQFLPLWIEKGWVSRVQAEEIIKSISQSDTKSTNKLVFFLSLFGVILFGTGVIPFLRRTGMAFRSSKR